MQPVAVQVQEVRLVPNISESGITKVQEIYKEAAAERTLDKKRELYESAFSILKKSTAEPSQELFTLLEAYATSTCYAQQSPIKDEEGKSVDPYEGFKKSARLMEFSFLKQLERLGDDAVRFNWRDASSLEDLIRLCEVEKTFDSVSQFNIHEDVLVVEAEKAGLRESLATTLTRMTFSHQNIPSVRNHETFRHGYFSNLTEMVIGQENLKSLLDYRYNRVGPNAEEEIRKNGLPEGKTPEMIRSERYEELKEEFKKHFAKDDPTFLMVKLAQIANMQGIILSKKEKPKQEELLDAEKLFIEAIGQYQNLMKQANPESKDYADYEHLLSNARTGIIHCLVNLPQLRREQIEEHKKALEDYLKVLAATGNYHNYIPLYQGAILKATLALFQ